VQRVALELERTLICTVTQVRAGDVPRSVLPASCKARAHGRAEAVRDALVEYEAALGLETSPDGRHRLMSDVDFLLTCMLPSLCPLALDRREAGDLDASVASGLRSPARSTE
jgi:hypothetical protein